MPGPAPELKYHHVRAGAGAGKTRGLVEKVVEIFRSRQKLQLPTRLVVTTFTRKATQELKERLTEHACRERDPALLQFVTDPNRLHISTIHGLLNVFLRQFGHLAGMDSGFQLIGAGESFTYARIALREAVLADADGLRWLETYGFDRVLEMCRRFEVALREEGDLGAATFEDIRVAALAETDGWRKDLKELALSILEEVDDPKWTKFGEDLRHFASAWSGDGGDLDALPTKVRRSKSLAHLESWFERTENLLDAFKAEMKKPCWNRAHWPAMAAEWTRFETFAKEFSRRLNEAKESGARFELADLELKTMEIIRSKPFLGVLFGENWDFWMIDEYQDTSPLQVACLDALSGDKPVYYVGDPQQSIYLFRGADVRVFDEAEKRVREKNGELVVLKRNYRSHPDLLLWINDFMSTVSPDFQRMDPREEAVEPSRACVRLIQADDEAAELDALVGRVAELLSQGASLEKICVLGRTHRTLIEVSRALRERGYPTHVHSSQGFGLRREVVDAQALWKFLINPHDNLNLAILFRSPWFYVADARLREWMEDKPKSLWSKLGDLAEMPESVERLRRMRKRQEEAGLARAFEEGLAEAEYLDLSLVNDPAGRKESNLWKLILKARELEQQGGQSVLDLLGEESGADLLDVTEGDATSAQEPNAINLMTVHGSKGLQFEHVLIPQVGKRPQSARTAVLENMGSKFFFPVFMGDEDEDAGKSPFVPSPLDNARVRDRIDREQREFNRLLYVAVTRAQSTLTLSWSEIARDSWAARSPLFAQAPAVYAKANYIYEIAKADRSAVAFESQSPAKRKTRPRWVAVGDRHEERKAVTELVSGKSEVGSGQGDYIKRWRAQTLGTRVHRALEALKYGHAPSDENEAAIDYVLSLQTPPMAELIQEGEAEWGFQVATPAQTVEGQIDLWGKIGGVIHVIDYKSGSPKGQKKAFEQLSLYAWALRKFGHAEPILMSVIFPLSEKTETREFSAELFAGWELKFRGTQARS